jgi:TPR repeat protein
MLAHLKKSAELNYSPAQSLLGAILLSRATSKIQQNEAINWLERAAFSGEIEAAMTLYHGFEHGIHFIEKNQCEAQFWLNFSHHIDKGSTEFLENMIKPCKKKI